MVALVRDHDRSARCSGNPSTSLDRCSAFLGRRFVVGGSGTLVSSATYHYDATGRMVKVEIDSDGDTNIDTTQTYTYDDRGLRVSQTDTATGETTTYLFDPQNHTGYAQVLEEWVDSGGGATLEKTYTLGHDVIAQASVAAAQVLALLYDGHGSTRAVVDEVGDIIQRYAYDAYGVQLEGTGLTSAANALTTLLYSGEAFNAATGLQYLRARWYNPSTGRFNRLDPFSGNSSDPVSLHKYLYTHANPVMRVDPTGMFEFSLTGLLVSTAISSLLTYILRPIIKPAESLFADVFVRNVIPVPVFNAILSRSFSVDAIGVGVGGGVSLARGPLGGNFAAGVDVLFSQRFLANAIGGNFISPSAYLWGEYSVGFGAAKTGAVLFGKVGFVFNTQDSSAYAGGYRAVTLPFRLLPKQMRESLQYLLTPTRFDVAKQIQGLSSSGVVGQVANRIRQSVLSAQRKIANFNPDTQISLSWGTSGSSWSLSLILGGRTAGSAGTIGYTFGYADLLTDPGVPFRP